VLLGIYYLIPWIPWGERQAGFSTCRRAVPRLRAHVMAQDFYFLTWLLVIAACRCSSSPHSRSPLLRLRVPQTVWDRDFLWMERLVEGSRSQQMKLAKPRERREGPCARGPSNCCGSRSRCGRVSRRRLLHADPRTRVSVLHFATGRGRRFWVLFYGGATYVNAGFMREQVCKYMCPYARFQSAMFDRTRSSSPTTNAVASRAAPQEGRGPKSKGLGDCVDCTLCVQVCPTGIDIRKGLQYECIACAACIDACDEVMDKVGYPRGLVRYDTQHGIEARRSTSCGPHDRVCDPARPAESQAGLHGHPHATSLPWHIIRDRQRALPRAPQGPS